MNRGLSVWLFSKVVMFIFLFLTFASVISFMKVVSDRTAADSAEVLAMQITDSIQTAVVTPSISSKIVVPLPKTLPESASAVRRARYYTMVIPERVTGGALSVAIGWGADPSSYAAASSVQLAGLQYSNSADLKVFSEDLVTGGFRYIVITKSDPYLCIQKCKDINQDDCDPSESVDSITGAMICG